MTALTKFLIGSIISYLGSLSPGEPSQEVNENLQGNLQKGTISYVHRFPAKEDSENYKTFICIINNFQND